MQHRWDFEATEGDEDVGCVSLKCSRYIVIRGELLMFFLAYTRVGDEAEGRLRHMSFVIKIIEQLRLPTANK